MDRLTPKQQAFCDYYIEIGNATESAIKAGYKEKTARFIGAENLTKPNIREYMDARIAEKASERIAKQDEVLEHLTRVMRREEKEYAVVTLRTKRVWYEDGKRNEEETEHAEIVEIPTRISDTNKAAELLGKRYALWIEKQQLEGNLGIIEVKPPPDWND